MDVTILDIVKQAQVTVPVTQVIIVIVALTMCLLFRFNRTGLVMAYLYCFHMGWRFCKDDLLTKAPQLKPYTAVYLVFGALVLLLTVISMIRSSDES